MALNVTPADVREYCTTKFSDSVIQSYINLINNRIGQCLEDNYGTEDGETLLTLYTCHFLEAAQGGSVTNKRAANGASISIEQYGTGEVLKSTPSGRMALSLDFSGCYSNLVADTFVFDVFGDPARGTGT